MLSAVRIRETITEPFCPAGAKWMCAAEPEIPEVVMLPLTDQSMRTEMAPEPVAAVLILRTPCRGTSDAALGTDVDFTKETDHEMEIRVCDGAHGSVRGGKRACSDRSRNDAHACLAGHQTSRHSTRQPARDPAGLATTAGDASAGNPQLPAEPDGHAGQSAVPYRSRPDGTVSSRHREPAVHSRLGLVADGDQSAGASQHSAFRAEVSVTT